MDTITHGLIGTLSSKTGFYQKAGRVATIAFTVGAIFPDIDIVTTFLGPEFSLRYHRGLTHSLIAAPLFAFILALVIYRFSSYKKYWFIVAMVALGIYSHIFFDLITSYGTVIFDPLSMKRYSWNLVFILDPFITIPVILGLILCWRKREFANRFSFGIFAYLVLYLILCFYSRELNSGKVDEFAKNKSLSVLKSSVYPRPLAPFFWMGVIETEDAFYKVNLSLLRKNSDDFERIAKTNHNQFVELAKNLEVTKLYFWFADYPVAEYKEEGGRHVVEFYDLRFGVIPNKIPFPLRIVFDGSDSIVSISLNGRSIGGRL